MEHIDWGIWALYYFWERDAALEEEGALYGISWEEQETRELVAFVRRAREELGRRGIRADEAGRWGVATPVHITRELRIYIGERELKLRPMAKTVLLLFLRHPEGIRLKCIGDYRDELCLLYGQVSRRQEKAAVGQSVDRLVDCFSNNLNVNISRVNAAVSELLPSAEAYRICGKPRSLKSIRLDRSLVFWE